MVNSGINESDMLLKAAFQEGFLNASQSLGLMTGEKIAHNNLRHALCQLEEPYVVNEALEDQHQSHLLLTTDLFGDIAGKSYLFLSEQEFQSVTQRIPGSGNAEASLKEEFIKELDNILSAAVITKLSGRFHRKMYGDVPVLVGKVNSRVEDIIYDDFIEQTSEVYIHAAVFSFETNPLLNPLFVWVFDKATIDDLLSRTE
jgi:chemotaxis protein CheY-P-specific phosphatase CheC